MARLHKLIVGAVALASLFLAESPAIAQEYCSLTVRVTDPDGSRLRISVTVEEQNGRVETGEQISTDVRFCDLGALPVTVKVGDDGTCNRVTVRDVPVAWREPYLLRITYDPEPCLRDLPLPVNPTCRVVFRIVNPGGGWASNVKIVVLTPKRLTLAADGFGRASFLAAPMQTITGDISGTMGSAKFGFQCSPEESTHEARISLRSP